MACAVRGAGPWGGAARRSAARTTPSRFRGLFLLRPQVPAQRRVARAPCCQFALFLTNEIPPKLCFDFMYLFILLVSLFVLLCLQERIPGSLSSTWR